MKTIDQYLLMIKEILNKYPFQLDFKKSLKFHHDFYEFMEKHIPRLMNEKRYSDVFTLLTYIFLVLNDYDIVEIRITSTECIFRLIQLYKEGNETIRHMIYEWTSHISMHTLKDELMSDFYNLKKSVGEAYRFEPKKQDTSGSLLLRRWTEDEFNR
jgi:hypothetical protein